MSLLRKFFAPPTNPRAGVEYTTSDAAEALIPLTAERDRLVAQVKSRLAKRRYGEALAMVTRASTTVPDDPQLIFERASVLFDWGRFREALEGYRRAEAAGLRCADLLLQLAWACIYTGNLGDAETWMGKAVGGDPRNARAHFGLATLLHAQGNLGEAATSYEVALNLQPDDIGCLIDLGGCRLAQGNAAAAEKLIRRAIAIDSDRAMAWNNLGVVVDRQDRDHQAREAFERAALLETKTGGYVDAFVNLAVNARDAGRIHQALDIYESNLAQRPSVDGHLGYSVALSTAGQLAESWDHHEFRWLTEPLLSLRPGYRQPAWAGQELDGKTILLRAEQGFGDTIQFIRYAPRLKALGATVVLVVYTGIEQLAREFPGVDQVLRADEPLPYFDFYSHLSSLPRVFRTDLASIPAESPYLHADASRIERWKPWISGAARLKVGLAWAGSPVHLRDRYRSMSLRSLAPLGELEGVRFFSLQKGASAEEATYAPVGMDLVDLGPNLEDFCDTAAVITLLDLVICVDSAVAHLAGALAHPVWVMAATPADWRWMEEREDTPWYPTMRLFRQSERGDWSDVVGRVRAALQERLHRQTCGTGSSESVEATRTTPLRPSRHDTAVAICRPQGLSAVTETRAGILQYFPDHETIGASVGWYGEFLQPQLDVILRLIKPGATVMEVGAGVGAHSLFLAAAVGPAGHLFLYEPHPILQRVLRQNLGANHVANVTLMKGILGLAREPECDDSVASGGASQIAEPDPQKETLDELQLERLEWLKINEGVCALDVLETAADTLWRLRPLLFIAVPDDSRLPELADRAKEFSYRCWRMETPLWNPENFNRRNVDIFSGRTALALLAIPEEIEVDLPLHACVELS